MDGRAPLLETSRSPSRSRGRSWRRRAAIFAFVVLLMYGHYRVMHALASLSADAVADGVRLRDAALERGRGLDAGSDAGSDGANARTRAPASPPAPAPPSPPPPPARVKRAPETGARGAIRCRDVAPDCAAWVAAGECDNNPAFMLESCARSCGACEGAGVGLDATTATRRWVELRSSGGGDGGKRVLRMPVVGFGTAGLGDATRDAVATALEVGYRAIDSAQAREWYREDLVGEAIAASGVRREDLFLTSKLHPRHLGFDATVARFEDSLADLRTEYLDLFLLHYPRCFAHLCDGHEPEGTWRDSWRALEALLARGKVRAIGVSNFDLRDLKELEAFASTPPAVVQRNSDVFSADLPARIFCTARGWQYEAYSSLGSQWLMRGFRANPVLTHATVVRVAEEIGASPARTLLRWATQKGQVVIPRSATREHIEDNFRTLDLAPLTPGQMDALDALDGHPPFVDLGFGNGGREA